MKNYICIDGKKIELSDETVENLKGTVEDPKYFDLSKLPYNPFTVEQTRAAGFHGRRFFQVRGTGEYAYKGFYLRKDHNWEIVTDSRGVLVLLPTKKQR